MPKLKYTRAFVTGSFAYGRPRESFDTCETCGREILENGSDVDLVVLVSPEDIEILIDQSEPKSVSSGSYEQATGAELRFGKLNLICCTSNADFQLWKIGTKTLKRIRDLREEEGFKTGEYSDVERDEAIALFNRLRQQAEEDFWNSPQIRKITAAGLLDGTIVKV